MKFAICNETFQDWPFDKAFAFARECGYTGIEFAPFTISKNVYDISSARRAEVRKQAEDAGLEVVGLTWRSCVDVEDGWRWTGIGSRTV